MGSESVSESETYESESNDELESDWESSTGSSISC